MSFNGCNFYFPQFTAAFFGVVCVKGARTWCRQLGHKFWSPGRYLFRHFEKIL